MVKSPNVFEHPEFLNSYNPSVKKQKYEVDKLKRFLQSHHGDLIGEKLKYEMAPFKSFPKGRSNVKCIFILCKDCRKIVLSPNCEFCGLDDHTINDAVLFYIGDHDRAYKEGKRILIKHLNK